MDFLFSKKGKIFVLILVIYILISYFVGYLFLKTVYKKVYKLANKLKQNNYINLQNYNFSENNELKVFFATINKQIDSISSFNKYLSHELKTPLINISSSIDLMNVKYNDLKLIKMKEHIFYIKDIIDTLNKLILLENKNISVKLSNVNICLLVKFHTEKTNIESNIECQENTIETSKELFSIILKNILDNAKKYPKSTFDIKITKNYIRFSNKTDKELDINKLTQDCMGIELYLT